jgi:hypothetical protein
VERRKSYRYCVQGLALETSRLVPGLVPLESGEAPDVAISFDGLPPWFDQSFFDECQSTVVQELAFLRVAIHRTAADTYWHFAYTDHTEYLVGDGGKQTWISWRDPVTFPAVCAYLFGPVFAFLLLLRGRTALHASVVMIDDLAVAFLGPAGAGKSTTAAKFAQLGFAVLSEDVLSLRPDDDAFSAVPGYPVLRLLPHSVDMLRASVSTVLCQAPGQEKVLVDVQAVAPLSNGGPGTLAAIYVLKPRMDGHDAPYIEPLEPPAGFLELLANVLGQSLTDAEGRARNFSFLARLAANVPVRKMVPHSDGGRLERMCELIIDDFRNQVRPRWKARAMVHV